MSEDQAFYQVADAVSSDAPKPLCPDEVTYLRYEALRRLNPRQFTELWKRNLAGENFDKMVDEHIATGTVPVLPPEDAPKPFKAIDVVHPIYGAGQIVSEPFKVDTHQWTGEAVWVVFYKPQTAIAACWPYMMPKSDFDAKPDDAPKMRSEEEVRSSLRYEEYTAMPPDGYHKGWCNALKWVLKEES